MTHGYPYPIPYYEQGFTTAQIGQFGNTPLPVGLLEMPISAASYLYYKAETLLRTIEFTPLGEGPGTRIDYTGATNWDGSKFVSTESIAMLNQLPVPVAYTAEMSDQEMRNEIRGYDIDAPPAPNYPGQWMGIRQLDSFTSTTYGSQFVQSEVASTMAYNLPLQDYETSKTDFRTAIADAISAWQGRLSSWLAAEQLKVPIDPIVIADIQRQQDVIETLTPQINEQADLVEEAIDQYRIDLELIAWTVEEIDALSRNLLVLEIDAFVRWINAEEKLEAYAVTVGSLWKLRTNFKRLALQQLQFPTIGWLRRQDPRVDDLALESLGFVGAMTSTADLAAISTGGIPALASAQIGCLTRELLYYDEFETYQNIGTPACATMFEVPYTLEPTSAPVEGIVHVSIGPVLLGLTPEMCVSNVANGYLPQLIPPVRVWDIPSQEVYDEVWPVIAPYWTQYNEASESSPGVAVGKFRIESTTADKIYECDLYANPSTVTAVNITLRVLTERT